MKSMMPIMISLIDPVILVLNSMYCGGVALVGADPVGGGGEVCFLYIYWMFMSYCIVLRAANFSQTCKTCCCTNLLTVFCFLFCFFVLLL